MSVDALVLPAAPVWAAGPGKDGATVVTLRVAVEDANHIAGLSAHGAVAFGASHTTELTHIRESCQVQKQPGSVVAGHSPAR
jgi:hypothetical protein